MTKPKEQPHSTRVLSQWADAYAQERGVGRRRVRNWISYMVLGGQLERANSSVEGRRFTIKGAVALEMRLHYRARVVRAVHALRVPLPLFAVPYRPEDPRDDAAIA